MGFANIRTLRPSQHLVLVGGAVAVLVALGGLSLVWAFFVRNRPAIAATESPVNARPSIGKSEAPAPATLQQPEASPPPPQAVTEPPAKSIKPEKPAISLLKLPEKTTAMSYDAKNGRLAIIGPWDQAIGVISLDQLNIPAWNPAANVTQVRIQGTARGITCRQSTSQFIVAQENPNALVVINAESLKNEKSHVWKLAVPEVIASPQDPESSMVYVAKRFDLDAYVALFDLDQGETVAGRDIGGADSLANHRFFGSNRTYLSIPNGGQMDFQESPFRMQRQRLRGPVVQTPWPQWIARGSSLISTASTAPGPDLDFEPVVFLRDVWCAGFDEQDLVVGSAFGQRILARIPLPQELFGTKPPSSIADHWKSQMPLIFLFSDPARQCLILGCRSAFAVIPWRDLHIPEQTLVPALKEQPSAVAMVGDEYSATLQLVSGTAQFEMIKGPDGMKLEGDTIRWTPQVGQVGDAEVQVRMNSDAGNYDESWVITTRQRRLKVPFYARGCAVTDDGRRALVWGGERTRLSTINMQLSPSNQLAIVDLSTGQIVVEATRESNISAGLITTNAVVIAENVQAADTPPTDPAKPNLAQPQEPQGGSSKRPIPKATKPKPAPDKPVRLGPLKIVRLSADKLEEEQTAPLPINVPNSHAIMEFPFQGGRLINYGEDQLIVATSGGISGIGEFTDNTRLKIADFSPAPGATQKAFQRTVDGWIFNSALWGEEKNTPQLLLARLFNAQFVQPGDDDHAVIGTDGGFLQAPFWNPNMSNLNRTPYGHRLNLNIVENHNNSGLRTIWLQSPTDLSPLKVVLIDRQDSAYDSASGLFSLFTSELMLIVERGAVFVLPLSKPNQPVRLERRQSRLTLPLTGKNKVTYHAAGATRYELSFPYAPGPAMSSTTGSFDVDLDHYLPKTSLMQYANKHSTVTEQFERLFGHPPQGSLLMLAAQVTAFGKGTEVDSFIHGYFVEVPSKDTPPGK